MNGFVSLGQPHNTDRIGRFPKRPPKAIIAPFWANADSSFGEDGGKVYYKLYTPYNRSMESTVLRQRVTSDVVNSYLASVNNSKDIKGFNASDVIIVTWHEVAPFPAFYYSGIEVRHVEEDFS